MNRTNKIELKGSISRAIVDVERTLTVKKTELVLNFKEVTFISVEGLEWLEELLMRASSLSLPVSFVDVPPRVYKVFKVAHIESLLQACGGLARSGPVC